MYANMVTGRLNRDDSDVRNEAQEALPEIARIFQDFDAAHAVSASFHQHYLEETRILKYWGRGASFLRQLYDTDTNGVGRWSLGSVCNQHHRGEGTTSQSSLTPASADRDSDFTYKKRYQESVAQDR